MHLFRFYSAGRGSSANCRSAAALTLSGGTLTGSTTSISSGSATMESCALANSPVTVSGTAESPGTLTLSCQLQSAGSLVPLTVQAGGSATVSGSEFQTTALHWAAQGGHAKVVAALLSAFDAQKREPLKWDTLQRDILWKYQRRIQSDSLYLYEEPGTTHNRETIARYGQGVLAAIAPRTVDEVLLASLDASATTPGADGAANPAGAPPGELRGWDGMPDGKPWRGCFSRQGLC